MAYMYVLHEVHDSQTLNQNCIVWMCGVKQLTKEVSVLQLPGSTTLQQTTTIVAI